MYISLSPTYAVRNEESASYLIRVDRIINNRRNDFSAFCIPPFIGYILAHIGDSEYNCALNKISKAINVSTTAIDRFVGQLVDNSENKEFHIDEHRSIVLPKCLLTKSKGKQAVNVYEENTFAGTENYSIKRPSAPLSANLMVTTRCTTDCAYCYADRKISPVMSTDRILSLIDELHSIGTVNLTLTGGDVFACPDWQRILERVRNRGYKPFLSTKTPISRDKIEFLKDLGYEEIQFSLDSDDAFVLKRLINAKDGYLDKARTFLKDCTEIGLNVLVRSVLTRLNVSADKIESLYGFLSSFGCIKEWIMTPAFFSPYKSKEYADLSVCNDDFIHVYEFSRREGLAFPVGLNKITAKGYELKKQENVEEYVCRNQICMANTIGISILANGNCSVCEMLYDNPEYLLGNVVRSSVKEIWNSKKALDLYNIGKEDFPQDSPCGNCQVFDKCRKGFGKRVCYLDIAKCGHSRHYPDPRCPRAEKIEIVL